MIVRNEAEVLAESLRSVEPIADEIVVLDTGSADSTPQIALDHGAAVYRMGWPDDFAAARNACLRYVTGDWVLWLNAGERLQAESAAGLSAFVTRQADRQTVYRLMVESPPAVEGASGEQVAQWRLMPNCRVLQFRGRVRESVGASMEGSGMKLADAPARILCHPRRNDPARKTAIARRDLALAGRDAADSPTVRPATLLAMGEAHASLGENTRAEEMFRRAIQLARAGSAEKLEGYYGLLSVSQSSPQAVQGQIALCMEALGAFPLDAQLLLAMGNYLQASNRIDMARRSFEAAVQHGQVNREIWHLIELGETAYGCLGLTLQLENRDDEARFVLQRSLDAYPNSVRLLRQALHLNVKLGRLADALKLVERMPLSVHQRHALLDAVRGACRAVAADWTPALGYLQAAYVAGCRDPLCLCWLAATLLANGQFEAAMPVLKDWQQTEPGSVELQSYLRAVKDAGAPPHHRRVDSGAAVGEVSGPWFSLDNPSLIHPGQKLVIP